MFTHTTESTVSDKIWQVSELNQATKALLDIQFGSIWLEGEISNFSRPSSGHWYFSLKDPSASIRGAMFKSANQKLGFQPKDGLKVLVKARATLYAERGEFQIVAEKMLPSGEGELRLKFEQLKNKLQSLGLFDIAHKKPLPKYPAAIGLITSPTGAAIQDMLKVLKRRYALAEICIYPTAVQGDAAAPQIVSALKLAQKHGKCDVLIVARGGGSLEDLWPFNEEMVAQAIYACPIPIVSGVGHEVDFTICDFVADKRAATPSVAAEEVSPDKAALLLALNRELSLLQSNMSKHLQGLQQTLDYLEKRLVHPKQKLIQAKERLDRQSERLTQALSSYLKQYQYRLGTLCSALDALNPLKVLSRGFAVVKHDGKIVKETGQVKVGAHIEIIVSNGQLHANVSDIKS